MKVAATTSTFEADKKQVIMSEAGPTPLPVNAESMHQFEALFNFATIGIVVTDSNGAIINLNKFAETQFEYLKEEVLGKQVEVLLPPTIHGRHVHYRQGYYQHPEPRKMGHGRDLYAQKKSGQTFPVEVSLSHYSLDNKTFVMAFVIDITVRKRHEGVVLQQKAELERVSAEIKKMNASLERKVEERTSMLREALRELEKSKEELREAFENEKQLSELKSGFVTMASHEFRTPLSTILSSAWLLEKYNEASADPRIAKHIQRIKNAVGGMKNILEDFLSLGKLEEGQVQVSLEQVKAAELNELLRSVVVEMETLSKSSQQINLHNQVQTAVQVDKNLLKNILTNLLSNAIKFSGEAGIINVNTNLKDRDFVLTVSDNGIGISDEEQQHLFERFFRAKNAINIQGTGLGLHIVMKYVELMQGRVDMHSKLNEGTGFTIYIPQIPDTAL